MIRYKNSWQLTGSVFPAAATVALPSAIATFILSSLLYFKIFEPNEFLGGEDNVFRDSAAWTGFSALVGFLVVFRTSQAYSRFWDGCTATHMMRTEWFDACSSVIAFCKYSRGTLEETMAFQHLLVRLFSMLHALALAEIEDSSQLQGDRAAFNYDLLDIEAIDNTSLRSLKSSDCKVELVFQWIQQTLVEQIDTGVLRIPPPILSRAFQELATGMVQFHDALKISTIPFPFPYAQTCDVLLWLHAIGTPFVMCQWVQKPWWAFLLSFTQVFVLWCLNQISMEIQNPFGSDANDIAANEMQEQMNAELMMLLCPKTTRSPMLKTRSLEILSAGAKRLSKRKMGTGCDYEEFRNKTSISRVFQDLDDQKQQNPPLTRQFGSMSSDMSSDIRQHGSTISNLQSNRSSVHGGSECAYVDQTSSEGGVGLGEFEPETTSPVHVHLAVRKKGRYSQDASLVKDRAFLAPKASGDFVVPSRKLWDPDQWGPEVNQPGIDIPEVPRPPWVTELPPAKAAQFGFIISRNGNFQYGGCCQQVLHECCSAHAQNNHDVEFEMCFNEESNLLTMRTLGRRKLSIFVAQFSENPKEYHEKLEGPNAECHPGEDFVIYAFDR